MMRMCIIFIPVVHKFCGDEQCSNSMAVQQQHSSAAVNFGGQKVERKALLLKERGNKHFSNKELTQALQCYSQVMYS